MRQVSIQQIMSGDSMSVLNFVNESKVLGANDAVTIASALKTFTTQVCTAWNIPNMPVVQSNTRSASGWNVCVVDQFPKPIQAYGYHEILNGQPIAYIRAGAFATAPLGKFRKGISFKGKVISKDRYQEGTASVVFHEVIEMLIDPNINKVSGPDSQGRRWLMEPADHVRGALYRIPVGGTDVIAPDWTLPAYYDLSAKGPYSYLNSVSTPFTLTPTGYGYYKDALGLHKI